MDRALTLKRWLSLDPIRGELEPMELML